VKPPTLKPCLTRHDLYDSMLACLEDGDLEGAEPYSDAWNAMQRLPKLPRSRDERRADLRRKIALKQRGVDPFAPLFWVPVVTDTRNGREYAGAWCLTFEEAIEALETSRYFGCRFAELDVRRVG
jgi:hypothetical protein